MWFNTCMTDWNTGTGSVHCRPLGKSLRHSVPRFPFLLMRNNHRTLLTGWPYTFHGSNDENTWLVVRTQLSVNYFNYCYSHRPLHLSTTSPGVKKWLRKSHRFWKCEFIVLKKASVKFIQLRRAVIVLLPSIRAAVTQRLLSAQGYPESSKYREELNP